MHPIVHVFSSGGGAQELRALYIPGLQPYLLELTNMYSICLLHNILNDLRLSESINRETRVLARACHRVRRLFLSHNRHFRSAFTGVRDGGARERLLESARERGSNFYSAHAAQPQRWSTLLWHLSPYVHEPFLRQLLQTRAPGAAAAAARGGLTLAGRSWDWAGGESDLGCRRRSASASAAAFASSKRAWCGAII